MKDQQRIVVTLDLLHRRLVLKARLKDPGPAGLGFFEMGPLLLSLSLPLDLFLECSVTLKSCLQQGAYLVDLAKGLLRHLAVASTSKGLAWLLNLDCRRVA